MTIAWSFSYNSFEKFHGIFLSHMTMLYSILTHLAYIADEVKLSDLLVDKSLHGLARHHSVASLIFMTSSITYSIVTLTIDGVTSFIQLKKYAFQSYQELRKF